MQRSANLPLLDYIRARIHTSLLLQEAGQPTHTLAQRNANLALLDYLRASTHIWLDQGDGEAGDSPELPLQDAHTLMPTVTRIPT